MSGINVTLVTFLSAVSFGLAADGGKVVFEQKFDGADQGSYKKSGNVIVKDGCTRLDNGSIDLFFNSTKPVKITFEAKVIAFKPDGKDAHFGFTVVGGDGYRLFFHTRGQGGIALLSRNKGKLPSLSGKSPRIDRGENAKWAQFVIYAGKNNLGVTINDEHCLLAPHSFIEMTKVSFYSYRTDWELRNLKIEEFVEKAADVIKEPVFSATFDKTLEAKDDQGATLEPAYARGERFVPGVKGQALAFERSFPQSGVNYELSKFFSDKVGSISFWVKSNNGKGFTAVRVRDAKGESKFHGGHGGASQGPNFNVARTGSKQGLSYFQRAWTLRAGDWYFLALSWREDGNARFFVNARPWLPCFNTDRCPEFFNADLKDLKKLLLGENGDYTIDELKIYRRPLTNAEVHAEYRSVMPVDMVVEQSIVDGEKPEAVTVQVAPGGGCYMRPNPVPFSAPIKAKNVSFSFALVDRDGKELTSLSKTLDIDKVTDIALPAVRLPAGVYTLTAGIEHQGSFFQKSFLINSFTEKLENSFSNEPLKLGKLVYQKTFDDPFDKQIIHNGQAVRKTLGRQAYLEAGAHKMDRFGTVITFDKSLHGKPLMMVFIWPDDKLRNMGLYMYPESKSKQHRDRLQTGIQSGHEYPASGRMQTKKIIFFPGKDRYLLEARTYAPDAPAALAELEIHEIQLPYPRLKIHTPEGMEGRKFGHFDEDQTFTTNLNADIELPEAFPTETAFQNDELMRYLDYTGQNLFYYPTWRYSIDYFPVAGHIGNNLYPGKPGELSFVFDTFARHGKKYMAMANYFTVPEIRHHKRIDFDFAKAGMILKDKFGNNRVFANNTVANFAHPLTRELYFNHFREPLRRYGHHPGFGGLAYRFISGAWPGLDAGYGDWTVARFTKDTGIAVPKDADERYEFLTGEKRAEWLEWRSRQVTEFAKNFRALMDEYNPELDLVLVIRQRENMYQENGFDFDALKKIPRVEFCAERNVTSHRWRAMRGEEPEAIDEFLYDFNNPTNERFKIDGAMRAAIVSYVYFESFNDSLIPDEFAGYFQDSDSKQHGRFFLKEFAFLVGAMDVQEIAAGGQPLGSMGRDEETREFTRAYCALPAKPFRTVPGLNDPAIVRFLNTKNGTYFYAVNMSCFPVNLRVSFGATKYMDLSTDQELSGSEIELLPFQLRSFLIPKEEVKVTNAALADEMPDAQTYYAQKIAELRAAAEILKKNGVDVSDTAKGFPLLDKALVEKHYAELHRLCFTKRMNALLSDAKNIVEQ